MSSIGIINDSARSKSPTVGYVRATLEAAMPSVYCDDCLFSYATPVPLPYPDSSSTAAISGSIVILLVPVFCIIVPLLYCWQRRKKGNQLVGSRLHLVPNAGSFNNLQYVIHQKSAPSQYPIMMTQQPYVIQNQAPIFDNGHPPIPYAPSWNTFSNPPSYVSQTASIQNPYAAFTSNSASAKIHNNNIYPTTSISNSSDTTHSKVGYYITEASTTIATQVSDKPNDSTTVFDDQLNPLSIPGFFEITEHAAFQLKDQLGKGGGGEVFNCAIFDPSVTSRVKSNSKFVAKVMISGGRDSFIQEISIMSRFHKHENFAQMVGYHEESMTLIMILYPIGSIADWIKNGEAKTLTPILELSVGICNALLALHKCGIVHNDIKPQNILVDAGQSSASGLNQQKLIAKLTDFGVCNIVEATILRVKAFEVNNRRGMSKRYAAPERLQVGQSKKRFADVAKRGDVYSTSFVIYEMVTRRVAWD